MARVREAIVAIRSGGQIMVVMIEAGTTMPPIPRPAMIKITYTAGRLSVRAAARAPLEMVSFGYF